MLILHHDLAQGATHGQVVVLQVIRGLIYRIDLLREAFSFLHHANYHMFHIVFRR